MVSAKDSKNLLVNWLNKKQATNVQTNLNKNSATNASNPTLTQVNPQTDLKAWTKSKLQEKNIIPATTAPISVNPNIIQQKASQNWVDPTGNANIMRFNAVTNNTNAGTNNFVPSTSPQSRFIGFQNLSQNTTNQQSAEKPLYIESEETKAKFQNLKENIKHRTNSQALMEFQGDVYKNKGKMSKDTLKRLYPEFKDNVDVLDELQKELRPIVQDGYGVDAKQLENLYPELLQSKNLKNTDKIKQKNEENNRKYQELNTTVNKVLKSDWKSLSSDGMRYLEDARLLRDVVEEAKRRGVEGGANDYEIMKYFVENNEELQAVVREMNALKLTKRDRANLGLKDSTILARASNTVKDYIRDELWLNEGVEASQEDVQRGIRATEILENKFGGQILSKVSTELGVSLDSLEKSIYRTYKDVQNWGAERAVDFVKSKAGRKTLEKVAGRKFTEEEYADIIKKTESIKEEEVNARKQNVLNYQDIVNKEYEKRKAQNLDPYVEDFVNNGGSMTNMLLNGQFRSFAYKSAGEAAQNADNLMLMLGGTVAPEVVLPAMFADSYARESQESFEELMDVQEKMGISTNEAYDNAQKGAAVVGLASSLVEVGLEKVIGGVETTASKAFHDMLMKDFTQRATKMIAEKGLMDLLKQGAVTQFKASLEEGLEEVLQQAIHNKAIQKYDPDQRLTEGMLEAFEGGFYNWMNLLAGGGDVLSNVQANKETLQQSALDGAYNAGVNARKAVDTVTDIYNNVRNKVTGGNSNVTAKDQTNITDNQGQNTTIAPQDTAITPVNNNIQQQDSGAIELQDEEQTENKVENKNTAIKEGGLTNKVLEQLNGLDENTRERIKKNPYSVEESKNLIKEMDENPGIDFRDYQNGRYEEVLDTVLKKLEQKENKRSKDIGTLYDKLEEANAPVDVTELKNKVAEFQAQAEALEDIATPAEQAQIKTILENIEKIGDGTMDVWKVRKIADKRSKRSASSSYDGIGLIWDIRDAIDDVIVKGNPDMKEVDKSYSKVLKEIGEIKGKLFYKNGGLKSNAVSTIKNMMNAGNRLDLNNLEKYIPGIKKQLQAIDDSKFVYNAYTTGKGSRFISGIARGVFGNIGKAIGFFTGGWGGLVAGAVVDAGVDTALVKLTRKALRDTITKETAASKAELERISKKIEEGEKLDAEDKARLKALGEKIMKNGEQMAKTKAEKEAWNKYMEEINDNITPQTTEEEQEKNKVTKKKATKKNKVTSKTLDKKEANEYNTTNASSNTSSVSLTEKEKKTTGTKSVVSEQRQGAEIQEDIPSAFSKNEKTLTKGSNFDISGVDKEYSDNYDKIISGEGDNLAVGKIDGSIAFDGKERPAIFSQAIRDKINKDHSLDKQNLLGTIDKPDYIIKDFDKAKNPDKDKINLIRKIPGTNNFVLVSAERQNGFFILTNYEIHRNTENKMMKEIKGYAKRGIIALDTIGDLTEALKEQPKNKVTSKKSEVTTEQENRQARKPREDQTRTELLYGDLEELGEKVEDADGNLTPIADVADKFTDYVHRVGMEKSKGEYDARNIAKAIKEYFDNHKIDDFYKKEVLRDDGVYRVEISDEALTDILNRIIELETGTKGDKRVHQITGKVTQGIIEEERKNKVTAKKTEATAPKQEENQTSEHFSYDEYGEAMDKIGEVEKEINEKLDKQMEQERAEKMKRFNELDNDENTDRSDGSEIAKLAGELNNLTNKYDRLKEEELKKQVPELLKKKEELRDAFGRDWKAVLDNKFAEIEKPFNELRDEYRLKLKEELGLGDDVVYDEKFYDSLTPEQKKIADRLNKEYADKYEELRLKTAGGEVETKEESKPKEESKSKVTNTKNKVTSEKVEVAQPKTETKTEDNPDLREKIGDRFYNYLKEQADRVNRGRKTLAPVTIEELLTSGPYHDSTKYIDIYERDVRNKLDNIMYQIGKLDLPEVKLTKEQQDQLYEASALNGDRDMIRIKLMKEWIDKNPSKAGEKLTELTNEGADMVEQLEKAKAYVAEIEKTQENKGNKTKVTDNAKNKVTNPSKSKETSLFNENEVDKGNKSEGLNPDALPLQDYKEMQRLENGRYYSLGNALRHEKLGEYMGTKIATELVGDYNEIIEDERDPDNLEDRWVRIESDIEDMYDAYEDYLNKKNEGDRDEREVKLLLETADDLANKVIKGKTAKELIDQYNPDYQTDLKIYKRLLEKYPNFYNGKINLNGEYGKALREFAGLDNETAQDIDYQELAERENETAQIPTIFEEDLEQMNLRNLEDNETPQTVEEESTNKVTSNSTNKVTNGGTNLDKAIEIIKNADATKPQQGYIGEDTYARASSSDVVIKTKGDTDFNQVSFYRKAVSLNEMAQNDTMFIVLNDVGEKGIENVNKVLEGFDLQYRVGSELDNRGDAVYYLENTNTGHKDYFSDEGRSEPALSKTLRDKTVVPRLTPEQQAEYDKQMEQRRKEQEAERERERQEEEKRKEEEAKRLEEENTRKTNLLTYVNDTYGDNPLQRGRVLKELSELNEESNHKIHYYGDEVPDNAEVWQVLDALADLNGSFSETRESGDNYTWTYNYGDNRSINRLTKAQKNYLEYRMNNQPSQNKTTTEVTGEKNAVTAKQAEGEKPKNLVTSRIENTKQEIQEIDKDTYFDDIVKNLKDHPREMFIYKDGSYFYPHYILPSGKVLTPENSYWGEVSSEEAARNWLLKEAEEHTEANETKKAEKLKEIVGKTAEKYEATLKRIESDNPMQEIWTSGDYFKYGLGNNQIARAKKESEANAEVGTFKKDVIDGKEGYRIFVAGTKNEAIRAFYDPKTGKAYRYFRGPTLSDAKPFSTREVEKIEKFLQNVDKQLDKETKKEKKEEKQVITQERLDSLKPDKDGVIELDYKGDERWALGKGKEALIKEGKADGKYLYNYGGAAHPQYMALYIKNGEVYEGRKGLEDQYMTTKQEAVDWLNQKEKDVEHESTERYTQTDYEILPKTISVEEEAAKAGPKRIAPDRVKWQQETYDKGLESIKEVLKQSPIRLYEIGLKSDRSKAAQDILGERRRIRELPEAEAEKQWNELAKSVYEDLVIKDISKGYRYSEDVTSKFPKKLMQKAVDARARYEKGLFTSFSAKDTRANNQYRDEIGAGIKSQDGKPVTQEQMNEIVDGIRSFGSVFGLDMKKFAEDNNIIYVHLHGGNPFMFSMGGNRVAGLYRKGADGNVSVSLGGVEGVMEKGEDGEMKKTNVSATPEHELAHAVDAMLDWKWFPSQDVEILKKTMNPPSRLINYYKRPHEITARAVEQYAADKQGKNRYGHPYIESEGYWDEENFNKYVKPIVEKNMNEKMKDYKIDQRKSNVTATSKNKVTSK